MLYFLFGKNGYLARQKSREIIEALLVKNKNASFWRFDGQNFDEEKIKQVLAGRDLFGRKLIVIFDNLFQLRPEISLDNLKTAADSENIYVILEEQSEGLIVEEIKKYAQKVQEFDELNKKELERWIDNEAQKRKLNLSAEEKHVYIDDFGGNLWAIERDLELKMLGAENRIGGNFNYNPFQLVDLLVKKKKKEAYLCFHKNLSGGVSLEEMFWKIWWQIKTLLAVSACKRKGLNPFEIRKKTAFHPFVIQKAGLALLNFSHNDLERFLDELFSIWIDSRSGFSDFQTRLERFILNF